MTRAWFCGAAAQLLTHSEFCLAVPQQYHNFSVKMNFFFRSAKKKKRKRKEKRLSVKIVVRVQFWLHDDFWKCKRVFLQIGTNGISYQDYNKLWPCHFVTKTCSPFVAVVSRSGFVTKMRLVLGKKFLDNVCMLHECLQAALWSSKKTLEEDSLRLRAKPWTLLRFGS